MPPALGCVADDITGAADLAAALAQRGVATALVLGVPQSPLPDEEADVAAVVVALKIRTTSAADARDQAQASAAWLQSIGAGTLYAKYCSTFDSTPAGNIGPVADVLLAAAAATAVLHCPAYPANGRTVYQGHLFVGDRPLHETGMRDHPLTPMTDADLVRVLAAQTPREVHLLDLTTVRAGTHAVAAATATLRGHVIADATEDVDLDVLAAATPAVAGGGATFGAALGSLLSPRATRMSEPPLPAGPGAVLSGSASPATRAQIEHFERHHCVLRVSPVEFSRDSTAVERAARWALSRLAEHPDRPVLVAVDARPGAVEHAQGVLGRDAAADAGEQALAAIAERLVDGGVRRLVVAGGETSGAVAHALGLTSLRIGPSIAPGVIWTLSRDPELCVAFKSGNFGGPELFTDAFADAAGNRAAL
jgi:uncharacterized protein YgbK (DUF1537 family)